MWNIFLDETMSLLPMHGSLLYLQQAHARGPPILGMSLNLSLTALTDPDIHPRMDGIIHDRKEYLLNRPYSLLENNISYIYFDVTQCLTHGV